MNNDEFNLWFEDYARRFPDSGIWMSQLKYSVLRAWKEALESVDFNDALEVNKLLFNGDFEPIKTFDRESIPGTVRRHAISLISRRDAIAQKAKYAEEHAKSEEEIANVRYLDDHLIRRNRSRPPEGSSRSIMDQIDNELAKNPHLSAAEVGKKLFPKLRESENDPRFTCWDCKDTRYVTVWSNKALEIAVQSLRNKTPLPTHFPDRFNPRMDVACTCQKAMKLRTNTRFSTTAYCVFEDGDINALNSWIKARLDLELGVKQQRLPY